MRWLDEVGREEARRMGHKLKDREVKIDAVVTSPLVRAVQTAELCAAAFGYRGDIIVVPELEPEAAPRLAKDAVAMHGLHVLAVSHEPLVSELSALLAGVSAGFKTGEVACFDSGKLSWKLSP
jgi:phosphohistidine phosphatase